jgi:hypothetical protein
LIGGKHEAEGIETMKWCTDMFISINVQETKKIYYDSFDKMLELGGNIIAFKSSFTNIKMCCLLKFSF